MGKRICVNGHDTFVVGRNTGGRCRACDRQASSAYQRNNPDVAAERCRRYYSKHHDKELARARRYYHSRGYLGRVNRRTDAARETMEALFGHWK